MTLHRVDPRFVLPHRVERAVVLDGLNAWRVGLRLAGVHVEDDVRGDASPDLVVGPARLASEARRMAPQSIIVEGSREAQIRGGGYAVRRLVLRPSRQRPTLALPLEHGAAVSYAVEHWSVVDRRWKALRLKAAQTLVSHGKFPSWITPVVTVATRDSGPPYFVAAAAELGVPADASWFLTFGQGDELSRNAFQLFRPGSSRPDWVLKFARIPGYRERFDDDERGLRLARAAGDVVAARVPQLVGRFDLDGVHASLETAASGRRLRDVLRTPGDRAGKLELIERFCDWILQLGALTRAPADANGAERARLRTDVLPRWTELGVEAALVDALPALPTVTQHNDLGTWNVVYGDGDFTVVDWENAREAALPLWDLLYFLADALVLLDGPEAPEQYPDRMVRLFAGEAPASPSLFSWVRRAVDVAAVPGSAVGPLATLCWLSHSDAVRTHNADLAVRLPHEPPRVHGLEDLAPAWMRHPALGPSWSTWRG